MAAVDPANFDPAIVSSTSKAPHKATPSFPPTAVIIREDTEATLEAFNWDTNVAVKCSEENAIVSLPRESAMKLPFIADQVNAKPKEAVVVPFKASAVVAINHWVETKGLDGASSTKFANPVLHTDINLILTDDWEKHFAHSILLTSAQNCIVVLNAAEKTGMTKLHEFCVVTLSCALRGKTENELCGAFGRADPFSADELTAVDRAYPWFEKVTSASTD